LRSASPLPAATIETGAKILVTKAFSSLSTLVTFQNSQGEGARGTLLRIERSLLVFEVYNPYSIVQLSEVLRSLKVRRGDRVIYDGQAVVINLVNTGLMLIVSVSLLDGWSDLNGLLETGEGVADEVYRFLSDWSSANDLRPGYMLAVSAIRGFLSELHPWLRQLDMPSDRRPNPDVLPLDEGLYEEITTPLLPHLYDLFQSFESEAALIPSEEFISHKRYAQHDLHPLLMTAPFVHRAFTKPLGYAGDYEMVNMMLRNSREGGTTYAQVLNSLHLKTGVAQAHRNRIDILAGYLKATMIRCERQETRAGVLNVGCGPALEIQELVREHPAIERLRFNLLDFNGETLAYTKEHIDRLAGDYGRRLCAEYTHASVHELLKKAIGTHAAPDEEGYDLIYCAGLFDYLSDKICSRLLRLFYHWLTPGGLIVVTNVHPSNPNRYAMEFILEWHLVYRNELDMTSLCPPMGRKRVYCDETGVNVFLEVLKPE
jgi:extracellular factor (EF) 3-hydroxypalmitic acid methyl ester biosynthesis protein